MTPPTVRVVNEDHRRAFASRNTRMAQWVEVRNERSICDSLPFTLHSLIIIIIIIK